MKSMREVPVDRTVFERYEYGNARGLWKSDADYMYPTSVLDECLKRHPLRMEDVEHVMNRSIVRFDEHGSRCYPSDRPMHWNIFVDEGIGPEEQGLHLIHEVIHVYYRVRVLGWSNRVNKDGSLTQAGRIEELIDQATLQFFQSHKTSIDKLIDHLKRTGNSS